MNSLKQFFEKRNIALHLVASLLVSSLIVIVMLVININNVNLKNTYLVDEIITLNKQVSEGRVDAGKIVSDFISGNNSVEVSEIKKNFISEIYELNNKFPNEESITESQKIMKEFEISKIRADSMWVSYCLKFPTDKECLDK